MNSTDIRFNKNKLISFLFELKSNIDNRVNDRTIENDQDAIRFIKKELMRVNNNIFHFEDYLQLNSLADQIFLYYFNDKPTLSPLELYINNVARFN